MHLANLIGILTMIFWIFPAVRQFRKGYFYYFLVLALSDPVMYYTVRLFKVHPRYIFLITSYLVLLAILYYRKNLKPGLILIFLAIPVLAYRTPETAALGIFVLHVLAVYQILHILVKDIFSNEKINFYFVVLFLYELTIIFKMAAILTDFETGMYIFYAFTAFDLLIAVFYMIFDPENSPKLKMVIG